MQGARTPLLKAKLLSDAAHPRALPTLLEAVALWHGIPVRAALVVDDERGSFGSPLMQSTFEDFGRSPLYTLEWVPAARGRRRRSRDLGAMGEFRDLERILLTEVARC